MNSIKLRMPPLEVKSGLFVEPDELTITVPFNKVRKLRIQINTQTNNSTNEKTSSAEKLQKSALLQYHLLSLEGVLRASVNAAKSEAVIVYDAKQLSAQELVDFVRSELQKLFSSTPANQLESQLESARTSTPASAPDSFLVRLVEDTEFDYKLLVEEGFHSRS